MMIPKAITIRDCYEPAMKIRNQAKAREYFEALVQRDMVHFGKTRLEAEAMERNNLGYYAGHCDRETRVRVEKLFLCAPPVAGGRTE